MTGALAWRQFWMQPWIIPFHSILFGDQTWQSGTFSVSWAYLPSW
jgi:hypothetical protein